MPININEDTPAKKAPKKTLKPQAEKTATKFAKSTYNPHFEEFEALVDETRKAVRKEMDLRRSANDDSDTSIAKYTDEVIKKHLRSSKWA